MSRPLVAVLLISSAIALAMAQTVSKPTTLSTETPPATEFCAAITKFSDTALMEPKTFMKNLDECSKSKENKTRAAEVLVALFNTLNATRRDMANLTDYPDIMKGVSQCVGETTGFNFTESGARTHFGIPSVTVSFKFEERECDNSLELLDCIEKVYTGHLNPTTKRHKNVYVKLFDAIAPFCKEAWTRDDNNSGHYCLPSFTLIMGSGLMIILKLLL